MSPAAEIAADVLLSVVFVGFICGVGRIIVQVHRAFDRIARRDDDLATTLVLGLARKMTLLTVLFLACTIGFHAVDPVNAFLRFLLRH